MLPANSLDQLRALYPKMINPFGIGPRYVPSVLSPGEVKERFTWSWEYGKWLRYNLRTDKMESLT